MGGLDRNDIELFLQTNEGTQEILEMVDIVHSYGIHGIPVLIINGGQAIFSGAVHADDLFMKFQEVKFYLYFISFSFFIYNFELFFI